MIPLYWLYLAAIGGIMARTLVPYLIVLQQAPATKFDRKFLVPAAIAVVLALLASPLVLGSITGAETYITAFIAGWGGSDIIREGLKVIGNTVPQLKTLQ